MSNPELDEFFNALYESMKDEILRYIIAKCGDTEDIDDIFQETFLEVAELLKKKGIAYFRKPEAVVVAIARQKIYRHFSFRQRLEAIKDRYELSKDVEEKLTDFEDFTIEDVMVRKETLEQVREILRKQDNLTRKIFYLRFYMDMKPGEIAEMLGVSGEMVRSRIHRKMKKIKRELEKGGWSL